MDSQIEKKVELSHDIIKKAYQTWDKDKVYLSFTGGKDSMLLLHLVKETLGGEIPSKVMFIEESHFPEVYGFVDKVKKDWNLDLFVAEDKPSLDEYNQLKEEIKKVDSEGKKREKVERMKELARVMKINAIKKAHQEHQWKALFVGIRWDEHEARSKENYHSPREGHSRIHPILHFKEDDVWKYIKEKKVPYCSLYDQGYRSLGEKEFTEPVDNPNASERAGRHKDKEKMMKQLRDLGYF